ncbi:MAG: adenylate/guanylate cyclase domain-containing protein [Myxococcota bacterium]
MDILLFHLEIIGLSTLLIALHALRDRLGLYPLVMVVGLLLCMMFVGGQLRIMVPVMLQGETFYTSQLHLALLLAIHVIIYALEGTRAARRVIASVALMGVVLITFRALLSLHLVASDPSDMARLAPWTLQDIDLFSSAVSMVALIVDGLLILVLYQGLNNLSERIPQVVVLTLSLTIAMVVDGLIYGGLSGTIALSGLGPHVLGKFTAGLAASLPMALYIRHQLHHHPERYKEGGLSRNMFDIVDLQRELYTAREALARSQAEVEHVRSVFGRYVVPDVVDEILKDNNNLKLGGELRDVTVVFSDIRGYSTLSETMNPEEIIELLNVYFGAMSEIITAERGTIIEFEGDAILTVFGAPVHQNDHAPRALRTALSMLAEVKRLNARWNADGTSEHWRRVGIDEFAIRIGIHSGPVVAGNVGSHSRTKYAVIGDTVNTAARVESLNKQLRTELLLSDATVALLDLDAMSLTLNSLGSHKVKGRREPVTVFTLHSLDDAP